ncbi:MAG: hypothetical protein AAFX06_07870 [Planctomycetota bacterium]
MDQRWRRNHDLPDQPPHFLVGNPPRSQATLQLQNEVLWLRRQLAALSQHPANSSDRQNHAQTAQLDELSKTYRQKEEEHRRSLRALNEKLAGSEEIVNERDRLKSEVKQLGQELKNAAAAASDEAQSNQRHFESALQMLQERIAGYEQKITGYEQEIAVHEQKVAAHEQVIAAREQVIEEHEQVIEEQQATINEQRANIQQLSTELRVAGESYQAAAVEAQAEHDHLKAHIEILRTDHETVELNCCDLDHYADALAFELEKQRDAIEDSRADAAREKQQGQRAIRLLETHVDALHAELRNAREENQRVAGALAEKEENCAEYVSLLSAEEQEKRILSTRITGLERQLEQSRLDVVSDRAAMERQAESHAAILAKVRSQLNEARQQVREREEIVDQREQCLQQVEAAARESEANAVRNVCELERRLAEQCHSLHDKLTQERTTLKALFGERAIWQSERVRLEQTLSEAREASRRASEQCERAQGALQEREAENDRLRTVARHASERVGQLESIFEELRSEQSSTLETLNRATETENQLRDELADALDRSDQIEHSLADCECELQLARQSRTEAIQALESRNGDFEQQLAQAKVTIRERHHQVEVAQRIRIESLEAEIHRLAGDREAFHARIAELAQRLSESELGNAPQSETRRLSRELAKQRETYSRERAFLYRRIDQLRAANRRRAA